MWTPTIVFDLDGTLIDTAPDLVEALSVTRRMNRRDFAPTQSSLN